MTGEKTFNELRMIAAPSNLEAYEVAKIGFCAEFPQSKLLGLRVFQTYGDVSWQGEPVITVPPDLDKTNLRDIFQDLKQGRSRQQQAYLQDCIDHIDVTAEPNQQSV